jgi:hypothetical protein
LCMHAPFNGDQEIKQTWATEIPLVQTEMHACVCNAGAGAGLCGSDPHKPPCSRVKKIQETTQQRRHELKEHMMDSA